MKKRILMCFLALAMIAVQIQPVMALSAEILSGKTIEDWSSLKSNGDGTVTVVGPTDDDARTGEWSLCATFKNSKTWLREYIETTSSTVSLKAGTEYSFGVWCKYDEGINPGKSSAFIGIGSLNTTENFNYLGETVDGWRLYYGKITPSKDVSGKLIFGFDANFSSYTDGTETKVLFDDLCIYEADSDVNLVYNGSFEENENEEEEIPQFNPEINSGKTIEDWGPLKNTDDANITTVGPTDYDARTGDWSLCTIFRNIKTWRREYIETTESTVSLKAGTEYSFGVWCKFEEGINPGKSSAFIGIGSLDNIENFNYFGETEDDWKLYYGKYTPNKDVSGKVIFGFDANFSTYTDVAEIKVLFDDFYISEKGTDENLVYNGSFEVKSSGEEPDAPGGEPSEYNPEILDEYVIKEWNELYHSDNRDDGTRVGPTNFDVKSGEFSLCINFPTAKSWQVNVLSNKNQVTLTAGTEYAFGAWVRTDKYKLGDANFNIGVGTDTGGGSARVEVVNVVETDGDWARVEGKYTPESNVTGSPYLYFDSDFSKRGYVEGEVKILFDDLYIKAAGADENLLVNPGFEDLYIDNAYDAETYDPANFMANAFSGGLAVGWRNPSTKNIRSIELYDITNGKETLLSKDFDLSSSKVNVYKVTKLINGSVYQYKLHITFRDGTESEYFTYGIPKARTASTVLTNSWRVLYSSDNDDGYTATDIALDSTEKHGGEASLKIVSNSSDGSNVYAMLSKGVAVELGENYRLTFWAKADNNKSSLRVLNSWKTLDGNKTSEVDGFTGTYDWKQFTIDITEVSTESINFYFIIPGACDSIWIDDFSFVKTVDGEAVTDNLFTNGDFETDYTSKEKNTVKGLTANGGDGTIELSWKAVSGASKLKLYQYVNDAYCFRGYIPAAATSVKIGNLSNASEHKFALSCVDEFGGEGELAEVTGETIQPDYNIYMSKLYDESGEVYGISAGSYTVKTDVRNNKLDDGMPVIQMVALYKGDIMKKLVCAETVAEKLMPEDAPVTLESVIEVPAEDSDQYHIEVFVWNSIKGMKILSNFTTFGQAE